MPLQQTVRTTDDQPIPHSAVCMGVEEAEAASRVIQSGHLAQGREVEAFEHECAEFVGRRFGVAVSSGTAGLQLALRVLGVPSSARIAQPAYACAALLTATHLQGGVPVLVDCAEGFNAGVAVPDDCEAVIAVHLFGAAASMPRHPRVVEDIAQSIGGGTGAGAAIAVASFYATKLMSTGEGGMLLTDDAGMAEQARDLRDYDNRDTYTRRHAYKMTDIQAAIGRVQLRRLPGFIARRREIAAVYHQALNGLPLTLPVESGHVYFRYVVESDRRDALEAHLNASGVEAKRPVYRPAHHYVGGDAPNADRVHARAVSIPIHPRLESPEIDRIIQAVQHFFL